MNPETAANLQQPETVAGVRQRIPPAETARTLSEVKDALRSYETTALAEVAESPPIND